MTKKDFRALIRYAKEKKEYPILKGSINHFLNVINKERKSFNYETFMRNNNLKAVINWYKEYYNKNVILL